MASSRLTPSDTVTSFSAVISARTGISGSVAKRTSRLVRMPTSRRSSPSTTGMPEMLCAAIRSSASARLASGPSVIGLTTMPASNFLTLRTSSACAAGSRLRWITPSPPAWAIAIARLASVTVSIAAEISGMPSSISRVSRVPTSTSFGSTSENAGSSRTSSKVRASRIAIPVRSITDPAR